MFEMTKRAGHRPIVHHPVPDRTVANRRMAWNLILILAEGWLSAISRALAGIQLMMRRPRAFETTLDRREAETSLRRCCRITRFTR